MTGLLQGYINSNSYWIGDNTPSSKNNRQWTGEYFIASERTQKWRKWTTVQWETQRERFIKSIEGLPKPLHIEFTFIRKSRHKFDYINLCQTLQDEMKYYKWIEEDDADQIKPYFGDYIYDKHCSGCLIRVYKHPPIILEDYPQEIQEQLLKLIS